MADTVQLSDPDALRAYAAKLAEVRQTLGKIGARTHTSLDGALPPMDEQSYPRPYSPSTYGNGGYAYSSGPELSAGWSYLSYLKTHFDSLALAHDGQVASLTEVAGGADRTVAAQVHIATEAATRLPETDAGGAAALRGVVGEAATTVPPPPEPGSNLRFTPRSETRVT